MSLPFRQDGNTVQIAPSVLGASILYCSRLTFGVTPAWSTSLEEITDLCLTEFADCASILIATFARATGDNRIMSDVFSPSEGQVRHRKRLVSTNEEKPHRKRQKKADKSSLLRFSVSVDKERKSKLTPPTPDEGYASFNTGSSSFQEDKKKSSLDLLLEASNTIEAAEMKHETFKEEIIREISVKNEDITNIEGTDVRHGNVFLYTVVQEEKA